MAMPSLDSSQRLRSSRRLTAVISQPLAILPKESQENNLQFVNITDEGKLDRLSRTRVRTQVMLEFHRKRRNPENDIDGPVSDQASIAVPTAPAKNGFKEQSNKMKLGPTGLQQWKPRRKAKIKQQQLDEPAKEALQSFGPDVDSAPFGTNAPKRKFLNVGVGGGVKSRAQPPAPASRRNAQAQTAYETGASDSMSIEESELFDVDFMPRAPSSSAWAIDPFNVVSLVIEPRTQALLHYYFNERLRSSWLMMPIRKGLLSLSIHDEALFHACISQYAASYYLREQAGDPIESVRHRTEAIRIVNERLGDPVKGLSDGTIAAVANIAIYESANGSLSSVKVHLDGLQQLVRMRGGIQGANFPFFVQRLIAWCDLHCANALSHQPRFPPLDVALIHGSMTIPPALNSSTTLDSFMALDPLLSIDSILQHLRSLSGTLQAVTPDDPENIWYSDQVYAVQRRLFDLSYAPLPQDFINATTLLDKSVATAALIFSYAALRDIPFNFRVVATMVTNLYSTLELLFSVAETANWAKCAQATIEFKPQRVFWSLAMGGVAAEGKVEYAWFCEKFARMCDVLGIGSSEEMKWGLEGVLWREELDSSGRRLWDEMRAYGSM